MIGPRAVELLRSLTPGSRVVIRHRLPDGSATDALGELTEIAAMTCTVATRRGDAVVEYRHVIAAKRVPSPPPRRTVGT